jgi:hypothetical protein
MTALVQQSSAAGATLTLTGVILGNTLTCTVGYAKYSGAAATPTLADASGQIWLADNVPTPQGITNAWSGVAQFSLPNANAGSHALTISIATSNVQLSAQEWSGLLTATAIDKSANAGGNSAGPQTTTSGTTAATSQASELAIVGMNATGGGVTNIALTDPPAGYTSLFVNQNSTGPGAAEHAYLILSATGAQSATWNWTPTTISAYQGIISTYKAVATATDSEDQLERGQRGVDRGISRGRA